MKHDALKYTIRGITWTVLAGLVLAALYVATVIVAVW